VTLVALARLGRGLVSPGEPVVFADDEGLLRGRAVFETLRVYAGTPFKLGEHLERLSLSAARLHLEAPPHDAFAGTAADAIAAGAHPDAVLRLLWTAGREGERSPVGLVLVSTLPADLEERRARGLRLAVTEWAAGALAGAKSTSYAENVTAQDEAARAGADDALFVAPDGTVLEAPTANVWFREGATLHTPSLTLPLLAGVTRATLVELAPSLGYAVEEGRYELERLLHADEVFLSSSVREVMPVTAVEGRALAPGAAAAALQAALRKAAAGYAGAHERG
jgi:branched-subunit amino acid aminotransferase/4-amino-4-deoxychorismate lyase